MAFDHTKPSRTNPGLSDVDAIQENFERLWDLHQGDAAPTDIVKGMWWLYVPGSGNWEVRQRNNNDDAWVTLWELDESTYLPKEIFRDALMEDIADFPAYSGNAGKALVVNGTEDGLEFGELILQDKNFINDSANAMMTYGITINIGDTAVDEMIALKQSDLAHGATLLTETDTFFCIKPVGGDYGGALLQGIYNGGANSAGVIIDGITLTTDTDEDSGVIGCVQLSGGLIDGTTGKACTADQNVAVVRNWGNTIFIWKGNGDFYYDGADQGAYDDFEDALACADLSANLSNQFNKVINYSKERLHQMGIISITPRGDGKEDIFCSHKGMTMLQLGAIAELHRVVNFLCSRLGITYNDVRRICLNGKQ